MNFDPENYTLTIKKEFLDNQWIYVGRVAEFPHLMAFEDSPETARSMLVNSLVGLKKIADRNNKEFPKPNTLESDDYSGRITLRISKALHSKIAALSEQNGISINSFIMSGISEYVGCKNTYNELVRAFREEIAGRENAFRFNEELYSCLQNFTPLKVEQINEGTNTEVFRSSNRAHRELLHYTLGLTSRDSQQLELTCDESVLNTAINA